MVIDNGLGFCTDTDVRAGALGLMSIRERVSAINGKCSIRSVIDEGTTVRVDLPQVRLL